MRCRVDFCRVLNPHAQTVTYSDLCLSLYTVFLCCIFHWNVWLFMVQVGLAHQVPGANSWATKAKRNSKGRRDQELKEHHSWHGMFSQTLWLQGKIRQSGGPWVPYGAGLGMEFIMCCNVARMNMSCIGVCVFLCVWTFLALLFVSQSLFLSLGTPEGFARAFEQQARLGWSHGWHSTPWRGAALEAETKLHQEILNKALRASKRVCLEMLDFETQAILFWEIQSEAGLNGFTMLSRFSKKRCVGK